MDFGLPESTKEAKEEKPHESSVSEAKEVPSEGKSNQSPLGFRLRPLPSDLKKVSAGSISLSPTELAQAGSNSQPSVFPGDSSEDLISESRRILASLVASQEPEKEEIKSPETKFVETIPTSLEPTFKPEIPASVRKRGNLEQARRALAWWLGSSREIEVSLGNLPKLLMKQPEIQGVAIIDQEGLILALESKMPFNYKVLANLVLRLFKQTHFAAEELEASFQDQVVIGFERMILQISYNKGFYLVAMGQALFSSKLLRRLRKVTKALARVEAGG